MSVRSSAQNSPSDLMMAGTFSHYFKDEAAHMPQPEVARWRLFGALHRLFGWVAERRARAVSLAELDMLDDRELADFGLIRADVPHLFDPEFVARWNEERDSATRRVGRS